MAVLERFSEREPDYWSYRAATEAAPRPATARPQSSPSASAGDDQARTRGGASDPRWPSR